jgi:uncharacterized protein (TIGR02147 family)
MTRPVFNYLDYRQYLREAIPTSGPERGQRTRLAEMLGCQNGFVSSVFGGNGHFSPEHGLHISRFLGHTEEEQDFFLLILHHNRAGSKALEDYYGRKIRGVLNKRKEISSRIHETTGLSESARATYYSSWHYVATHMAMMIPALQSRRAIAKELGLSLSVVDGIVKFFCENGLAKEKGDKIIPGSARLHLPAQSPLIARHHTNWRMKAIQSLDSNHPSDLHYSLVMSISETAVQTIRARLLQEIQALEPILKEAADETLYALNMDLFKI